MDGSYRHYMVSTIYLVILITIRKALLYHDATNVDLGKTGNLTIRTKPR